MLNEHVFKPYVPWMNRLSPAMRVVTLQNRLDQSAEEEVRKRTVSACYDVGNDFFGWVLGPSMVYTCAIWPHADASLEEAQENKLRIVTEKARIDAGHRVLDLGCGWGTLCDLHPEDHRSEGEGSRARSRADRLGQGAPSRLRVRVCRLPQRGRIVGSHRQRRYGRARRA